MEKKIKVDGILYILFGKRNTVATLTNEKGQSIVSVSCGTEGFKGRQRGRFFANRRVGFKLGRIAKEKGLKNLWIRFRGTRRNRIRAILKGLKKTRGIVVGRIYWDIRKPHNGCRPRKQRRR